MENKLVNVAIANAFYEERKNLLDTYYPFVIKSFNEKNICSLDDISKTIKSFFDIELPINTIKNILSKNQSTFQIKKETKARWNISLSRPGQLELTNLIENEKKTEKRIASFYVFIKEFAEKQFKKKYEITDLTRQIDNFVQKNLYALSVDKLDQNSANGYDTEFEKIFIQALTFLNDHNSEFIDIFDDIWKGSVIWNELKKESFEETDKKLGKHLTVFVDTNFALSLLDLHNPIINKAAKELLNLIQGINNISLAILDITINELCDLLDLYDNIKDNFTNIEVDSVFYYLKQKGYSTIQIERLKDNIAQELNSFGIHKQNTVVLREKEQQNYALIYDHLYEKRAKRNEKKPVGIQKQETTIEKSTHHDTSVITQILRQKDRFARNFEDTKSIFLTSSFNLFQNYGTIHRKLENFPSVILDTTLTNILYLKNPQKNSKISLNQVIKSHCNYLIVDQGIWNSYLTIIKTLKKEDKITIEDYTRLITKNQTTQEYLLNTNFEKINESTVKEVLERIKNEENVKNRELSEKEKTIVDLTEINRQLTAEFKTLNEEKQNRENELIKNNEETKDTLQRQIDDLRFTTALKDYIDERMETDYYPLAKLIWLNVFVVLVVFFLFFLSDLIITNSFSEKYSLSENLVILIKAVFSLLILALTALLSNLYRKDFWAFLFSRRKLRKEMKERFRKEFYEKTVGNMV